MQTGIRSPYGLYLSSCTIGKLQLWSQRERLCTEFFPFKQSTCSTSAQYSPFADVCIDTDVHIVPKDAGLLQS